MTICSIFNASEISLDDLIDLDKACLRELFPRKTTIDNDRFDTLMQHFEQVNLARTPADFTFLYHYNNYASSVSNAYSYTPFMEHYRRKYQKHKGSMKLDHLAGHEMMDYLINM